MRNKIKKIRYAFKKFHSLTADTSEVKKKKDYHKRWEGQEREKYYGISEWKGEIGKMVRGILGIDKSNIGYYTNLQRRKATSSPTQLR